jgi:hypothetical protein
MPDATSFVRRSRRAPMYPWPKVFRVNDRFHIRYSAEAYNVTNHPSFDAPNTNAALYTTSSGKPTLHTPAASVGLIQHTLGSPRYLQMSLRVTF